MTRRRITAVLGAIIAIATLLLTHIPADQIVVSPPSSPVVGEGTAQEALQALTVKGRAPKTGYSRDQFGDGWKVVDGCNTRQIILNRDLTNVVLDNECRVQSGQLKDPYTGAVINFVRSDSEAVQIDHVVALSDAWQKGAQSLTAQQRIQLANDPLELLAVDGPSNQQKGDSDAASWLPDNVSYRCEYVARQIAIKQKYQLWVTSSEKDAMQTVLSRCPDFPAFKT